MAEAPFIININTDLLTKAGARRIVQEITATLEAQRAAEHPAPQPEPPSQCDSFDFRPHHRLQFIYLLAGHGYPSGVKCAICGDTWPIRPRGEQRLLEQLKQMRADITAQYEKLTGDPIRQSGYYVAVQLLNDIINPPTTE